LRHSFEAFEFNGRVQGSGGFEFPERSTQIRISEKKSPTTTFNALTSFRSFTHRSGTQSPHGGDPPPLFPAIKSFYFLAVDSFIRDYPSYLNRVPRIRTAYPPTGICPPPSFLKTLDSTSELRPVGVTASRARDPIQKEASPVEREDFDLCCACCMADPVALFLI